MLVARSCGLAVVGAVTVRVSASVGGPEVGEGERPGGRSWLALLASRSSGSGRTVAARFALRSLCPGWSDRPGLASRASHPVAASRSGRSVSTVLARHATRADLTDQTAGTSRTLRTDRTLSTLRTSRTLDPLRACRSGDARVGVVDGLLDRVSLSLAVDLRTLDALDELLRLACHGVSGCFGGVALVGPFGERESTSGRGDDDQHDECPVHRAHPEEGSSLRCCRRHRGPLRDGR